MNSTRCSPSDPNPELRFPHSVAVYDLMRELAHRGAAILMISSELPEVIGMSDRILVMHDGRVSAELEPGSSEEAVLAAATGTLHTPEGDVTA